MIKEEASNNLSNNSGVGLLGDYLKQKRLDKNYSLEKLSQKTKISVNILKSLEANDFEHLPSAAYIKGFVTSYVKVLGIPLDEAINKMEYTYLNILGKPFPALNHTKQMSTIGSPKGTHAQEPSPHELIESSNSIMENTKSVLPVIIFLVVVVAFIGGYKLISSIIESEVNSQKSTSLGPKIESSSALVKPTPAPPVESKAQVAVSEKTVEAPIVVNDVKVETKPSTEFVRNFPTLEFKKVRGKLFSVKTDATENSDAVLLPETIKSAVNSDMQNVYIKAVNGNTWLSYKIDNNPIESVIINQNNDLFLQGSEIRVFLGNVNVTKIFYNNYMIETPTKSGVKTLIFPEESNAKFLIPLFPKANDDILYTAEDYIKRMALEEEEVKKRQQ